MISAPPRERLAALAAAAAALTRAEAALPAGPLTVLTGGRRIEPMRHYPDGDAFDGASHAQFYAHAHRGGDHGHIHLFLRPAGMPAGLRPVVPAPETDAPAHLVAVGFHPDGRVNALFTTNRWVTGEPWYAAADVKAMLPYFRFETDPVGRWLTALVALTAPLIEDLLDARDAWVARRSLERPAADPLDDGEADILSEARLNLAAWRAQIGL